MRMANRGGTRCFADGLELRVPSRPAEIASPVITGPFFASMRGLEFFSTMTLMGFAGD
jgi:hypothetical protein